MSAAATRQASAPERARRAGPRRVAVATGASAGVGRAVAVQLPSVNTPQFDWSHMHFPHRHQPVGTLRYGPPLHTAYLEHGRYDWEFTDLTFGHLRAERVWGVGVFWGE